MSHNPRVPVIAPDGKPLMPTKASRARKWIASGKAIPKRTKEDVFCVQLVAEPSGRETQPMALALDPGSKYDGYAVSGEAEVVLLGMAVLPRNIHKRMDKRREARHTRRNRKCRRRPARFLNRGRPAGWIAPSQLAKVQLRIRLLEQLCQLFPISDIVIEDVRYNHYRKRGGKHFSTVEIGKTQGYVAAEAWAKLWKIEGWETLAARKANGITKSKAKDELSPESHAHDAWAMACWLYGDGIRLAVPEFYVWRRQECNRRSLHRRQFSRDGVRNRYGGTTHPSSILRKGDVIRCWDGTTGYVGGWTRQGRVVSLVGANGKRIRRIRVSKVRLIRRAPHILTARKTATTERPWR